MKFKIDVNDFWLGESSDLAPALKRYIIKNVVAEIYGKIEKKIEKQIEVEVKLMVEKTLYQKTSLIIDKIIKTEEIALPGYNSKKVKLDEYIKECFLKKSGWREAPSDRLEKLAKEFSAELKQRYDLAFASHIVAKVNEQGMLKDDVAKLLLEDKNGTKTD